MMNIVKLVENRFSLNVKKKGKILKFLVRSISENSDLEIGGYIYICLYIYIYIYKCEQLDGAEDISLPGHLSWLMRSGRPKCLWKIK